MDRRGKCALRQDGGGTPVVLSGYTQESVDSVPKSVRGMYTISQRSYSMRRKVKNRTKSERKVNLLSAAVGQIATLCYLLWTEEKTRLLLCLLNGLMRQ